ncbi:hypothetical protein CYMTET_33977 [Cymbomonas tetramitiformis]|uniref:Uncharacterized protein n=1 Tax=Cymbomonas tetramitiformis TaxID=36881 RepID=A0AAE0FC28_9CHLO|nr:hypothetical protein CYMTET_33977 [Cymbomonas tetramitiformis]
MKRCSARAAAARGSAICSDSGIRKGLGTPHGIGWLWWAWSGAEDSTVDVAMLIDARALIVGFCKQEARTMVGIGGVCDAKEEVLSSGGNGDSSGWEGNATLWLGNCSLVLDATVVFSEESAQYPFTLKTCAPASPPPPPGAPLPPLYPSAPPGEIQNSTGLVTADDPVQAAEQLHGLMEAEEIDTVQLYSNVLLQGTLPLVTRNLSVHGMCESGRRCVIDGGGMTAMFEVQPVTDAGCRLHLEGLELLRGYSIEGGGTGVRLLESNFLAHLEVSDCLFAEHLSNSIGGAIQADTGAARRCPNISPSSQMQPAFCDTYVSDCILDSHFQDNQVNLSAGYIGYYGAAALSVAAPVGMEGLVPRSVLIRRSSFVRNGVASLHSTVNSAINIAKSGALNIGEKTDFLITDSNFTENVGAKACPAPPLSARPWLALAAPSLLS